jgi:S-DNA-T family DNA segregation ATPase FtsK/SpoIIIE
VLPLTAGESVVGRDETSDLTVADPSLSRRHFAVRTSETTFEIRDLGSTNGTRVEGEPIQPNVYLRMEAGQTVSAGRTMLTLRHRRSGPDAEREAGTVRFNRPPRVATPYDPPRLDLPMEPGEQDRRPLQYAAMLIPLLIGGVMAYALKQPIYLLFMVMSPAMMISTWVSDRRSSKKGLKRAKAQYKEDMADFERELKESLTDEVKRRRGESPDVGDLAARARERTPDLWERRPRDLDFLRLGVGSGRQQTRVDVRYNRDPIKSGQFEGFDGETVDDVPVNVDLPEYGVVGLYGDRARVQSSARWLAVQAACLHDPAEVAIVAIVERPDEWEWLKWLPHVDGRSIGLSNLTISSTREQIAATVASLRALVEGRAQASEGLMRSLGNDPRQFDGRWIVLITDENAAFESTEMARLLDEIGQHGTAAIWLGTNERALPGSCGFTVGLRDAPAKLRVTDVETGKIDDELTPDGIDDHVALDIARELAPVRVVDKHSSGSGIPTYITASQANGISKITGAEIINSWESGHRGLSVVLGAAGDGPIAIDLERDGPHGLVAGTTGAGKSEFLQNFVAGLAINYTPERVSFLFVDYKGGSAFKDCINLPHAAGMVTDLDEHLANRVLTSLGAEIRRREHLLNEHRAKDLIDLRRAAPDASVPSLIIVVDEFAALVSEVPAFVDGLVDIAQRGRSLGVHLILATQKPGGNVSPAIRANMNLRVALATANESESSDIIESPEAARISRETRGRGFVRLGHDELVEFQSAYVGGAAPSGSVAQAETSIEPFTIREHEIVGEAVVSDETYVGGPTELAAFTEAIRQAADRFQITDVAAPWLPALRPVIKLSETREDAAPDAPVIGIADVPAQQRQFPLEIDLAGWGSALIYGAGGTGKTTFLRTIAATLSEYAPPEELTIYGLDCAGRALGDIEALPNVGAVVSGDDDERTRRLLRLLRETIDRRSDLFAEAGAIDVESYRRLRPGAEPEPRIVLLLDSYAGFFDRYDTVELNPLTEVLPRLIAEGPAVGVHVIATGDRRMAVPMAVASIVPKSFVLQMANEDEDMSLGLPRDFIKGPKRTAGRAITEDHIEVQVAIVGDNPARDGQAAAIGKLAEELHVKWGGVKALAVGTLPTEVSANELVPATEAWMATVGIDDATMRSAQISLEFGHFIVTGPYRSGRSEALRTIAHGLAQSTPDLDVLILAPRRTPLRDLSSPRIELATSAAEIEEKLAALSESLAERSSTSPPLLVVVDDALELGEGPTAMSLDSILRLGVDANVRVVAAFESSGMRTSFTSWVREIKKHKNGVLLDPDRDLDGDILGIRLGRSSGGKLPEGRGFLVRDGQPALCQLALVD